MKAGDNKEFWQRTAKSYGSVMKHSWKLYDTICERIRPGLTREMNVLELACGSGQLGGACPSVGGHGFLRKYDCGGHKQYIKIDENF